jgi:ubiquinone/menaquinone biosynthesis C-methylase UbiE
MDPTISDFYARHPEENRLESGLAQLEALRTKTIITRHAPPPPATICDIGGGAGAYAFWLASAGYQVHLLDASERLISVATERNISATHKLASVNVGDARAVPFPDCTADLVLLLGPLYHLVTETERAMALSEARRILKPGGLLFAAAISRWASALDGLARDLFADPIFWNIVERDVREGQHRNTSEHREYFTTAYFHRPEELRREISSCGLNLEQLYGLEGPASMFRGDFEAAWSDQRIRADIIRVAELMESEASLVGVSAHFLAVARKLL